MTRTARSGNRRKHERSTAARGLLAFAFAGAVAAGTLASNAQERSPSADLEYRLGPQDKVRVRVLEWLPAKGVYQAWEALDGEYAVSASGFVSMPLIGTVGAGGRDTQDLAGAIGAAVQRVTGLREPPAVSVEIAQFRPIYVVGAVKTPGEYAWRPELDVMKAIGLAGGRYRPFEGMGRLERDVITQTGVVRAAELEILRTLARQARLSAETAERAEIAFPARVTNDPAGPQIIAEERALFASRRDSLARQLAAIDELKTFLGSELEALKAKATVLDRQVEGTRTELSNATTLASRGLSTASRQFAVDRVLGDLQSDQLDLTTATIRVRQGIATAEREKIGLVEERRLQLVRESQESQASLDQLEAQRYTAERLIFEASVLAPREAGEAQAREAADAAMRITRERGGRKVRIDATRDTPVQPGDVVEIIEPLPSVPAAPSGAEAMGAPPASTQEPSPATQASQDADAPVPVPRSIALRHSGAG